MSKNINKSKLFAAGSVFFLTVAAIAVSQIVSFNSVSAEPFPFSDGFDATPDGYVNWTSGKPENGKWEVDNSGHTDKAARAKGDNNTNLFLYKSISTVGYNAITLEYWFQADNLEGEDKMDIQWSGDGGLNWSSPLYSISDSDDDEDG